MRQGFDNAKYIELQAAHIRERIAQFGGKLYLEFGGKLFDDYHASRVLPGFQPDTKFRCSALPMTARSSSRSTRTTSRRIRPAATTASPMMWTCLRLVDAVPGGSVRGRVCVTQYATARRRGREHRLNALGIRTFRTTRSPATRNDVARIVSDDGYGKNEYIETTAPARGRHGTRPRQRQDGHLPVPALPRVQARRRAGYAKFETFPIWNLPLKHPVNLAYEAATADLNDVNMIDPFHLEAYGETTVNYNRDVEIFPVVNAMFELIAARAPTRAPRIWA